MGALLLLGTAACDRLPPAERSIAAQLEALPVGIQAGDSTTRFYLTLDRSSLRIERRGQRGDTTEFVVNGTWRASDPKRMLQTEQDVLAKAFGRDGFHVSEHTVDAGRLVIRGSVFALGDGTTWRIVRDIPAWSSTWMMRSTIPLRLDRWRKIVVDTNRPGKAVFVLPADIDHDGRPEILAGAFSYHRVGAGDNQWTRTRLGGTLGNIALAADLDRDGSLDLIGTRSDADYPVDSTLVWLRGSAQGTLEPGIDLPHGHGDFLQGIALADTNAKSAWVALSWHKGRNGIQLLSLTHGKPDSLSVISTFSQDEQLTAADIDRDGRIDLVTGTRWLRRTDSAWVLGTIDTTSASPDRNRVSDINGDGIPDVVTGFEAISVAGPLRWYEQTATGGWISHDIATVTGPMSLDLGDLDGDGDIDVVVGEHNLKTPKKARLLIFENLGGGKAWRQIVVATGEEHHDGAQLVDIDNDGDPDIISVGWGHPRVLLYENLAIP